MRGAAFGGAMEVGYLPDMFGHIAQMPQILRLAGFEHAVVWRGVPTAIDRRAAFWWEAPDGSTVRAEYLPVGLRQRRRHPRRRQGPRAARRRTTETEIGDVPDRRPAVHERHRTTCSPSRGWAGWWPRRTPSKTSYVFEVTSLAEYLAGAPTDGLARVDRASCARGAGPTC